MFFYVPLPLSLWHIQKRKTHIRLEIGIEIELECNQSEERKSISGLVNFALIGQNPI